MQAVLELPGLLKKRFKNVEELLEDHRISGPSPSWAVCLTLTALDEGLYTVAEVSTAVFPDRDGSSDTIRFFIYGRLKRIASRQDILAQRTRKNGVIAYPAAVYRSLLNGKARAKGYLGWALLDERMCDQDRERAQRLLQFVDSRAEMPDQPEDLSCSPLLREPAADEPIRRSRFRRWRVSVAALVLGLTLTAATALVTDPGKILSVIDQQGAKAGLDYALATVSGRDARADYYLYELAWAYYQNDQFIESRNLAKELLAESGQDRLKAGQAEYLLSLISFSYGDTYQALTQMYRAIDHFRDTQQWHRLHLAQTESARICIIRGDETLAQLYLEEASESYRRSQFAGKNLAQWYYVSSLYELNYGTYQRAQFFAIEEKAAIPASSNDQMADALTNLALIYALNGDVRNAELLHKDAEEMIFALRDEDKRWFNELAEIAIKRARNESPEDLVRRVRNHAIKNADAWLSYNLDMVLSLPTNAQAGS